MTSSSLGGGKIRYQFLDKSFEFPTDVKNLLKNENVFFVGEFDIRNANISTPGEKQSTLQCGVYTDMQGANGGYHIRNLKWTNVVETQGQAGNNYSQSNFVEETYHITSYFNVDFTNKIGEISFRGMMPEYYLNDANDELDGGGNMVDSQSHTESYMVLGANGIYENVTKVIIYFEANNPIRTLYFCGRPLVSFFTDTVSGR